MLRKIITCSVLYAYFVQLISASWAGAIQISFEELPHQRQALLRVQGDGPEEVKKTVSLPSPAASSAARVASSAASAASSAARVAPCVGERYFYKGQDFKLAFGEDGALVLKARRGAR